MSSTGWRKLFDKLPFVKSLLPTPGPLSTTTTHNTINNTLHNFKMDVDGAHFRAQLLPILRHIANAKFISFDLEMSGINTRSNSKPSVDRSQDVGKPSLQSMYEEMRNAAETFQVLQVGITCVEEDRDKEYYLARPFNFNLSPLAADGVDLRQDRHFTFSSSACDFLTKNHFDFGKVFTSGVPYLSREEEDDLREEFNNRASKISTIPDISISPSDLSTLEFIRSARRTISEWVSRPKKADGTDIGGLDYVNIGKEDQSSLNGFQRRLIHQLVRKEFPTLRAFARCDGAFMQIEKLDVKRENEFQARKLRTFNALIAKQKGLRWVFEALCNGDLSGINPEWFWDRLSQTAEKDLVALKSELSTLTTKLRNKKHILVGHNLFMDLGYFYKTFVGPLPLKVKHFQEDIHNLFPTVIDTKFLATHGDDVAMGPRANLKELLEPFLKVHRPLVVLCEGHAKYGSTFGLEHEAGFDSWMTAELFIKLTYKLYTAQSASHPTPTKSHLTPQKPTNDPDLALSLLDISDNESSDSSGGVPFTEDQNQNQNQCLSHGNSSSEKSLLDDDIDETFKAENKKFLENIRGPAGWHEFMLGNPFAVLGDYGENNVQAPMPGETTLNLGNGVEGSENGVDGGMLGGQWIPEFGKGNEWFWGVYRNKLRVNASESGVCDLEEGVGGEDDDEDEYESE